MNQANREQRVAVIPSDYDPLVAPYIWMLEDTRLRTKQELAGISPAELEWIPPEGGNSVGTILYHLAVIELSYLYEDILQVTDFPPELESLVIYDVRDGEGQLTAVRGEALAAHLARLDAGRALLLTKLRALTASEFRRVRAVEAYDITPEWALHHVMQHEAEHRGHIAELRRRAQAAGVGG
ncbi:MAG: DinB family protein [Caldilineaceae bacterium]